jgi:hypothetical protein
MGRGGSNRGIASGPGELEGKARRPQGSRKSNVQLLRVRDIASEGESPTLVGCAFPNAGGGVEWSVCFSVLF